MGAALVWAAIFLMGWQWGLAATFMLAYEGWTIINANHYDTISDIIRDFSRRQLLTPWVFGFAFGIGIATGYISNPYVIAALGLLQGHFFFTLNEKREEAIKEEAKVEVRQEQAEARADLKAGL
jgi:hypothetical protein